MTRAAQLSTYWLLDVDHRLHASLALAPLRRMLLRVVKPANFHCEPKDRCEPRMQRGNNDHARANSEQNDEPTVKAERSLVYCTV